VDVGSPESETAHAFAITDETWNGTVHSCYDVYEGNKTHFKVSDEGRACTGEMRFRVAIDPDNRGVVLRRRVDRRRANMQEADVVVDGAVVPQPWHFRELPAVPGTVWYDSEFAVPAGLTAGKKQLDIVVRHRASDHPVLWEPAMQAALPVKFDPRKDKAARGINAFQFWVFTLGPTTVEEPPEMPHALSAGPVEKDGMRLRWASHDDTVQSYTVERRGVTEPAFSEVAGVGADERSVTVSGLAPGTFYEFRVRARNRVGESLPATLLVRTEGDLNAANPLRKAKASASSVWESKTGGSASAANDGDMDTRWNSAQGRIEDQWLAFDLAEPVRLCGLLIYQETSWTTISAYRIQVMVDGDWKDVYHGRDMPDVALCRFPPVTTGGVRIWIDSTTGNTPTIKEVAAFGAPGEPKQ
jgi:hypothetical protein